MSKKIIINGINLEGGNIVPLLLKVQEWQALGHQVTFYGPEALRRQIEEIGTLQTVSFISLAQAGTRNNKAEFIWEALKRNWYAYRQIPHFIGQFDVVYTISPVLDFVVFPYFLKKKDSHVRWVTVFDNTVPLILDGKFVAGNKLVRLLAWLFYQLSLLFLYSADAIFVIKPELYQYLRNKGFHPDTLVVTGNGVERDLILKARALEGSHIDALFIGRINAAKGIYDMLKVLKKVKSRYPDFQLAIMGKGDAATEKNFRKKISDLDLTRNIQFLGYRIGQEKFDLIKKSKIFLFLSETESVPIAPLEAVCSGRKTLVYDLDAYAMYKNHEVIVFKKHDTEAVADTIINIFDQKDFENKQGELLLDKYSWKAISQIEMNTMNKL